MKLTSCFAGITVNGLSGWVKFIIMESVIEARKVLGWKPKHENVDDVIATAWNWHKSHPKGYEDK